MICIWDLSSLNSVRKQLPTHLNTNQGHIYALVLIDIFKGARKSMPLEEKREPFLKEVSNELVENIVGKLLHRD